jgi:acyl-CoA thioester hydrolase
MNPVFQWEINVRSEVVDENGHMNNVAYVEWMQEVAIRHAEATGCKARTLALGAAWVARTHHIEYLRPGLPGDAITVLTWVSNWRKVRSLRKYRFVHTERKTVLVKAETDWVFVDAKAGRARAIPDDIQSLFQIVPPEQEPKALTKNPLPVRSGDGCSVSDCPRICRPRGPHYLLVRQ